MPINNNGYTGEMANDQATHRGDAQTGGQYLSPVPSENVNHHASGQGNQTGSQFPGQTGCLQPLPELS